MHIRRAAVPASPESDTSSPSLALLPLLSLSVLVFIILFLVIRLFKRSLHLPGLTWLRGKGQGAKRSLGLSGVELLPTSLKPIPTPGPSPYAASYNLEGNAGKGGSTSLLSRSSSLDGFPQFVVTVPSPPSTSPGRSHSRSPFAFPALFNSKRKPLHRRSRSLGGPVRDLTPPTSLVTGSSAPPTPSSQALLIDFSSSSNSSTSTSSDLGTHKFIPGSPPLIPGLPIPTSSPARPFTSKSHTFPASNSHVWTFDQEDDADDSRATDPLLTVFKRSHPSPVPLPKSQPEPEPLIHYDRSTSPSPFRAPPTPALAPKRVSTANPFASLASPSSSSAAYIPQRPLSPSPSPLSLSPVSPPGIELVPVPVRPASAAVELVSITHSSPGLGPRALTLVDLDTDEEPDVTQRASHRHHINSVGSEAQETPAVFVPPPSPRPTLHQSNTESRDMRTPPPLPQEPMSALSTRVDLAADPFDDTHAITLSETEMEEDPWGTHLPLPSAADIDNISDHDGDREHAYTHTHPDQAPSAAPHSPSPVQQPLALVVVVSAPSSPIPLPASVEAPVPSSPSPATESPAPEPPKALSASWQWDDAWSSVPPLSLTLHQHDEDRRYEHESGWPMGRAPREGADVEARGVDVTDADVDSDARGEVEDDLISFERDTVASRVRGQVGVDAEQEMEMEMDPADAWFAEEPTAVWDVGGGVAWSGDVDVDVDGKEGKGGALFGMEKDEDGEDEREVQIRFLDGLLAGPSAPIPVPTDVHVFEEQGEKEKEQEQEPSYEDQDQEDEVYDSNDVHDIDDTTTATATTARTTVDTTTITTTTLRSVLSTPTTPNTPLPSLPSQPLDTLTNTTTISSIEEHPDPDLLPLPSFPCSPLPRSPAPLSPQPLKPHSEPPSKPLSPAQTPTPPASPPPTHHVPAAAASRPLWSLRAADAPPLGLPAAAAAAAAAEPSGTLARGVFEMGLGSEAAQEKPVVEVEADVGVGGSVQEATAVVVVPEAMPEEKAAVTILVDTPKEDEKKEEDYLPTEPQGLALSTSLPGSFPSSPRQPPPVSLPVPAPAHLSLLPRAVAEPTTSNSSSTAAASASTSTTTTTTTKATTTTTRAVQARANLNSNSTRLRPPRSALDLALAMQLRPGLGAGADPAWMVRFLMVMFGWVAVLISGDV